MQNLQNLKGAQRLSKKEQQSINGGSFHSPPAVCPNGEKPFFTTCIPGVDGTGIGYCSGGTTITVNC